MPSRAWKVLSAVIALPLAGCYTTARTEPPTKSADLYIGKTLYTRGDNFQFCSEPRDYLKSAPTGCATLKAGTPVAITELVKAGPTENYLGTDASGRQGYITSIDIIYMDSEAVYKAKMAEKAECDRKGGIRTGMTRAQLYASCWGRPGKINTTITGSRRHEQLVYGGQNYVYLEDGVVTSIQTSN